MEKQFTAETMELFKDYVLKNMKIFDVRKWCDELANKRYLEKTDKYNLLIKACCDYDADYVLSPERLGDECKLCFTKYNLENLRKAKNSKTDDEPQRLDFAAENPTSCTHCICHKCYEATKNRGTIKCPFCKEVIEAYSFNEYLTDYDIFGSETSGENSDLDSLYGCMSDSENDV